MLTSVSLFASANAGELSVSGTAKATYNIHSGLADKGKGIGITNELNFTAAGELDNGYTWSYSMELDPADGGTATNDDSQLVIGMNNLGTIGFFDSEGGLSQELAYGVGALGVGTDWGNTMTVKYGLDVSNYPNIQYHLPAVTYLALTN